MKTNYEKNTQFVKMMKEKIPVLVIGIQTLISNTLYSQSFLIDSHIYTLNNISINHDLHENKDLLRNIFWLYFPLLCIVCGIWEFYNGWNMYKLRYKDITPKKLKILTSLYSTTSIITFIIFSYYINNGRPFIKLFNYNYMYASIIFYMWGVILSVINYIDHNNYNLILKKREQKIHPIENSSN